MIEINLSALGEEMANNLLSFEGLDVKLSYYTSPPQLDVSGERWTLGNDSVLILAGERDDVQTLSESDDPEVAFEAFAVRVIDVFHGEGMDVPTHVEFENPRNDLRVVWEDLLTKGLVVLEDVSEDLLCPVPEL